MGGGTAKGGDICTTGRSVEIVGGGTETSSQITKGGKDLTTILGSGGDAPTIGSYHA